MKILFGFVLLLSCGTIANQDKDGIIRGIQARQIMPIYDTAGKIHSYDTLTPSLYYRGNKRMYDFTYRSFSYEDGKLLSTTIRHRYVLATSDSSFGIDYDSTRTPIKRRAPLDTLFKNEWVMLESAYSQFLADRKIKLTASYKDQKTGALRETYNVMAKEDTSNVTTCELLYTDSLPWLHLPYTKELDEQKKMRLIRTVVKSKTQFYKPYNKIVEGFTIIFDATEISANKEQWDRLMKHFE